MKTFFNNRIDFVFDVEKNDEESGLCQFKIRLHPDRYEWKILNGETRLYDKLDNAVFPKNIMEQIRDFINKTPLCIELPDGDVQDIDKYVISRLDPIRERALGKIQEQKYSDKSNEFLESLKDNELEFAIISIDIVSSTALAQKLVRDTYSKVIDTFLYEMSAIVPKHHGHILKYQGDGFIAYFPSPSFIVKNDFAFDCAMLMRKILIHGINPVFMELGLPIIGIRIGIESGAASILTIGNEATKRHVDIIGEVVNLAIKIQACADPNGICVGDIAFRNLYTPRRLMCRQIVPSKGWSYVDPKGEPYKVFMVILDGKQ
ncbi:MAG: adenylate/guanylate cyclase domain-containing protein [Candidatus Aminicenantes bacterium]|nr:adenylate/guanylate cyclase domain-containing protein [Candidatus Aminicenantes bacterium]